MAEPMSPLKIAMAARRIGMKIINKPQEIVANHQRFALIPWLEYERLVDISNARKSDIWYPRDVINDVREGKTLVRAWRAYTGFTQSQLAKEAEVNCSYLSKLEREGTTSCLNNLRKLARAMQINMEQLIDISNIIEDTTT